MGSRRFHDDQGSAAGLSRSRRCGLLVFGAEVGELVHAAGGYLCDQARSGWDVTVLLAEECDVRPLNILGITTHRLRTDAEPVIADLARGETLVIGVDRLVHEPGVRDDLTRVADRGVNDVIVWGSPSPGDLRHGLEPATHRLSTAARAFKARALAVSGMPLDEGCGDTEPLFRVTGGRFRRLRSV